MSLHKYYLFKMKIKYFKKRIEKLDGYSKTT